jgi:hypothetical protein
VLIGVNPNGVWTPLVHHYNHLLQINFAGVDEHHLSAHQRVSAVAMVVPTFVSLLNTMANLAMVAAAAAGVLCVIVRTACSRREAGSRPPTTIWTARAGYVFDVFLVGGVIWAAWQIAVFAVLAHAFGRGDFLRSIHAVTTDDTLTLRFAKLGVEQARLADVVTTVGLGVAVVSVAMAAYELRPGARGASATTRP